MVNEINGAPRAVRDPAATPFETPPLNLDVLANDSDPEGDSLRMISATSAEGEVGINAGGTMSFLPADGFSGLARIFYKLLDRPVGDPVTQGEKGEALVRVAPAKQKAPTPATGRDGIVTGTNGPDVIDLRYQGDPNGDMVDNQDALITGQRADDDIITAGSGDDVINAGKGNDEVDAGPGEDRVVTASGSDTVLGGTGDDIIDTAGPDLAPDQGYPFALSDGIGFAGDDDPEDDRDLIDAGQGDDLVRSGDDRDTIDAGAGDDTAYGGIDDDEIDGGSGDDLLIGGEGRDTVLGGTGDDTVYGGNFLGGPFGLLNISDERTDASPYAPDRNPENGRDYLHGGGGDDRISGGDDSDTLMGGQGDDDLSGDIDDDVLNGGDGDDTLHGGEGSDTLMGGAGRDMITGATAGDIVLGGSQGDDFDTLDLRDENGFGVRARVTYTSDDREDGVVRYFDEDGNVTGFLTFSDIESVVNCFTPGTGIATPMGEQPVERLQVGDRVITRDNGMQEIRWIGQRHLSPLAMAQSGHLRPVLIKAGALGNDLPVRDMLVSPNHRVLVVSDQTALYFEDREVFVAAKFLTDLPGVEIADVPRTTYFHLMFDHHEVILSNGSWTESFQPGDMSLAGVDDPQRCELLELFPELAEAGAALSFPSARKSLKRFEAALLTG